MISSSVGRIALPFMGMYSATKFAVEGLGDALRVEMQPFNVNVVLVEPGRIRSPFYAVAETLSNNNQNSPYAPYRQTAVTQFYSEKLLPFASTMTVAETLLHILQTDSPKTRYIPGWDGKFGVFLKNLLGDRAVDMYMKSQKPKEA